MYRSTHILTAAALAAFLAAGAQAQTVAVAPTQAPPQDMARMKADANAVVAKMSSSAPLGYLCFRGEDGVRRTVSATFDEVLKSKQEAAGKAKTAFSIGYDRKQAEAMVTDELVATCVSSYVGRGGATYPSF